MSFFRIKINMEKRIQKIEILNISLALINIITSLSLLKITIEIILTNGGAMGIAYIIFPFLIAYHLFIIPSILSLFKKFRKNKALLFLNIAAILIICLFSFVIFSSKTK